MKYVLPVVLLLAAGGAAQAKLTPFDGARESTAPATATSAASGATSTASAAEQSYFRAPAAETVTQPGRCSVSTFVFTKIRLAQACY
ncbi:hypothetical protein ASD45_04890 [Pseudolabrys sp. Root1462]|uniref:hypothetical protein n=1 Tax=Pseudolabrys sp. Root1462 TaxID=1736466 RepID=UPI0007024F2D|nr:hypothetical protein [Pseudolabrys sp. Root1462]KQZ00267.1 hypothetical protein ASD45_04890 [Pseudolabrys sp. Root1462]